MHRQSVGRGGHEGVPLLDQSCVEGAVVAAAAEAAVEAADVGSSLFNI